MYRHMASGVTSTGSHGENGSTGHGSSCYCDCPPFMGFGFCFAMKKKNAYLSSVSVSGGAQDCAAIDALAGAVCPAHGIPRQCHTPPQALDEDCSDIRYVHASSHVCGMWRMHVPVKHVLTNVVGTSIVFVSYLLVALLLYGPYTPFSLAVS